MEITKEQKLKVREAQHVYILAKAHHETILGIENEIKTKVLTENNFQYAEKWSKHSTGRILDYRLAYLMSDTDFTAFIKLVHDERTKRCMQYPEANCTFDYQSFPELIKAEENLIDAMQEIIPKEIKKDFKGIRTSTYKNEFIDLSMRLAV